MCGRLPRVVVGRRLDAQSGEAGLGLFVERKPIDLFAEAQHRDALLDDLCCRHILVEVEVLSEHLHHQIRSGGEDKADDHGRLYLRRLFVSSHVFHGGGIEAW